MSLRALRQAAGLMPTTGHLLTAHDVPLAPPVVEALIATPATSTPLPPPVVAI